WPSPAAHSWWPNLCRRRAGAVAGRRRHATVPERLAAERRAEWHRCSADPPGAGQRGSTESRTAEAGRGQRGEPGSSAVWQRVGRLADVRDPGRRAKQRVTVPRHLPADDRQRAECERAELGDHHVAKATHHAERTSPTAPWA